MLTVIKPPFKLFPEYLPCIENTVRSGLRKKGKSIQKWKERCVSNFTLSKRTRKNLSIIPSSRDLFKKKRKKHTLYFPYSIPLTITDFNRPLSRFGKISSIGPSEISKGKENSIPGHEETKSRLTGALDGAREKPPSLSLAKPEGTRKREREKDRVRFLRGHACSSFARGFVCARCPDVVDTLLSRWPLVSLAVARGRIAEGWCTVRRERERGEWEERREQRRENERRKLVAC